MKRLPAILTASVAMSLVGFNVATNPIYVDGKLIVHGHEKRKCSFQIIVKGDENIVARAITDTTGHFDLSFTPAKEKCFDFFYVDSHHSKDTIFLKSYQEFESDLLEVTFYTFRAVLPVDEDDLVICPKCKISKHVKAIEGSPRYYYCSSDRIMF